MNQFDTHIEIVYTTGGDDPESYRLGGTVVGLREFCDWLDACLHDLSDAAREVA